MLVLFDNGTPRTLARYLIDHHTVTEARVARMSDLLVATSGNGRSAYRFAHAGYTLDRHLVLFDHGTPRTLAPI